MKPRRRSRKEPIRLISRRHNYFPQRFMWRGQNYSVNAVVRAWTKMQRKSTLHFFRVRYREGTFDICQDIRLNTWYMARQVR